MIQLISQLGQLLSNVGFDLTKYRSNCRSVLCSVPESDRAVNNVINVSLDKSQCSKTLGLVWNTDTDTFLVKVDVKSKAATRRGILSMISQIYDPLGMVQPCILQMKRLMQQLQLCNEDLSWDETVPERYEREWNKFLSELSPLQDFAIPRCFKPYGYRPSHIELHTFCDASQVGYGGGKLPMTHE